MQHKMYAVNKFNARCRNLCEVEEPSATNDPRESRLGKSSSSDSSSESESSSSSDSSDSVGGGSIHSRAERRRRVVEGLVRVPGQSELVLDMGDLGQLRYNQSFAFLRAHCPKHGRACLRQRTVLASTSGGQHRQGQGRPIGLLLDWLAKANQYEDAQSHKKMGIGTFDDRVAARARVLEHEGHESFLQVERPQNEDEDEEPRRIP